MCDSDPDMYWQQIPHNSPPTGELWVVSCKSISFLFLEKYRQVSNISCTLVGNQIVDHSDKVGASPVGAAPTTSSFST